MSGVLEPIAALGLACNILQVIGVGLKTVQIAKQVYADGELDPALTDSAIVLQSLCRQIRSATAVPPSTRSPTGQEKQLLELAQKCQDAARDLREEVAFLNGQGSKTKLVAVLRIAAKTTWRKRRLERLSQKLQDAERLLQAGLLSRIYEQSVKTNNELSTLDASLRTFIHEYRNDRTSAIDLIKHTMAKNKQSEVAIMSHITQTSKQSENAVMSHTTQTSKQSEASLKGYIGLAIRESDKKEQDTLLEAKRGRLLRSLKFDRMNERRNQVSPSHTDTLSWVLEDGSDSNGPQDMETISDTESDSTWDSNGPQDTEAVSDTESDSTWDSNEHQDTWDSFSDWLRSTETVYWISGKPGSGKTTLMKYLLDEDQTREFLELWKPNAMLLSHFFWRPGTSMQQSIRGLFCSLLHQLLLGEPAASDQVIRSETASNKDTETDWSYEELRSTFHQIVTHYPRPIAMFLDGLDEVLPQDGVLKLLDVIEELKDLHGQKIKLCLGSRREPLLSKRLGVFPQLRLEQLNLADLRQYAKDHVVIPDDYHISPPARWIPDRITSRIELKAWLVKSLTEKAEGVFLWLCLTTTTIKKALNEGESVEDITHRVDNLPEDLSNLFADMWARANNDGDHFRKRAASYLQVALAGIDETYPLNPFVMMVTSTPEMARLLLEPYQHQQTSVTSLVEACEATLRDTASRCAGLLVCPSPKEVGWAGDAPLFPWHGEEYNILLPYVWKSPAYSFLHRTARDFLTDTEEGKRILEWSNFTQAHAKLKVIEARLTIHQLFRSPVYCAHSDGQGTGDNIYRNFLGDILQQMMSATATQDGEFERIEITRLLLICERLLHDGYLFTPSMVPFGASEFDKEARTAKGYTSYEATVKCQHEFLLWAAFYAIRFPKIWIYLCPMIMCRNLDKSTVSQLLIDACSFSSSARSSSEAMESRSKTIHALVHQCGNLGRVGLHREFSGIWFMSPWQATFKTPFRALIMSLWAIAISFDTEPHHSRKLLELVLLSVAHGADLQEEVHVTIELRGDQIRIGQLDLWRYISTEKVARERYSSYLFLVVSYPAIAVLTQILNLWKLTDLPEFDWAPKNVFKQGSPIAVAFMDTEVEATKEPPRCVFESEDIYPVEPGSEAADEFRHLIRLAEDGLRGQVLGETPIRDVVWIVLASVTASREIHERLAATHGLLRSRNVSDAERRRRFRERLGIQTPLEEPEWRTSLFQRGRVVYKAT